MSEENSQINELFNSISTLVYSDNKDEAFENIELSIPQQFAEGAKFDVLAQEAIDQAEEETPTTIVLASALGDIEEEEEEEEGENIVSISLVTSVNKACECIPAYKKHISFVQSALEKLDAEAAKEVATALKEAMSTEKVNNDEFLTNMSSVFINPLHPIVNSVEAFIALGGIAVSEEEEAFELAPISPMFTLSFPCEHQGLTNTALAIAETEEVISFLQSFAPVAPFFNFVIQLAQCAAFEKIDDKIGMVTAVFTADMIGEILAIIPQLAEQLLMGPSDCCGEGCDHEHHH